MLPGPIFTVSTRVSRYQVQSKTSLHLTSHLTWPIALSPRAWHLGKNYFHSLGVSPFRFNFNPLPTSVTCIPPRDSRHRRPGTAFLAKQKLPAPSARGVAHAPGLLLPVSATRARRFLFSVLVRVPYLPPRVRRSGRGGTPGLRIFSHQGRGFHCEEPLRARDPSPGSRRRPPTAIGHRHRVQGSQGGLCRYV